MKRIAGIDGAKGGWLCVSGYEDNHKELRLEKFEYFSDIESRDFDLILVDIPIGLDIDLKKGGRIVDNLARKSLLANKSSKLSFILENKNQKKSFSYRESFFELKFLDSYIKKKNETIIFESHPEIIFQTMKKGKVHSKKKDEDGIIERKNLLEKNGFSRTFIEKNLFKKDNFYKQDDFLDACSLFWSANRVALNKEIRIPNNEIVDIDGIIMQIRV